MIVLVDTPVWSLAYRRKTWSPKELSIVNELHGTVLSHDAVMIGPVRQEVLSGLREPGYFELLRSTLRAFEDLKLVVDDFENAAILFNRCRAVGIQGSSTDFLLCTVAQRYDAAIFTTDRDFPLYAKHIDIKLHKISESV